MPKRRWFRLLRRARFRRRRGRRLSLRHGYDPTSGGQPPLPLPGTAAGDDRAPRRASQDYPPRSDEGSCDGESLARPPPHLPSEAISGGARVRGGFHRRYERTTRHRDLRPAVLPLPLEAGRSDLRASRERLRCVRVEAGDDGEGTEVRRPEGRIGAAVTPDLCSDTSRRRDLPTKAPWAHHLRLPRTRYKVGRRFRSAFQTRHRGQWARPGMRAQAWWIRCGDAGRVSGSDALLFFFASPLACAGGR
jgi:hypothetical protein